MSTDLDSFKKNVSVILGVLDSLGTSEEQLLMDYKEMRESFHSSIAFNNISLEGSDIIENIEWSAIQEVG